MTTIASMSIIRKVVRNDAIKLDPPEVYNWRVFAIACAVSAVNSNPKSLLTNPGLFWWYSIWHGVCKRRNRRSCLVLTHLSIGIIGGVTTMPDFQQSVVRPHFTVTTDHAQRIRL